MAKEDEKNSEVNESFLAEIDRFHQKPDIDEYLRLRQKNPTIRFDYITSDGIEFLFSESKYLLENDVDPVIFGGAFEGSSYAHGTLSLHLLRKLRDRDIQVAKGKKHLVSRKKAISDALVNYLIANMLDSYETSEGTGLNGDLFVLIKYQLGVLKTDYISKSDREDKRRKAMLTAVALAAEGETPSYRKIAARMGVQPSTVMRWFPDNSMILEAKKLFGELQGLRAMEKRMNRRS